MIMKMETIMIRKTKTGCNHPPQDTAKNASSETATSSPATAVFHVTYILICDWSNQALLPTICLNPPHTYWFFIVRRFWIKHAQSLLRQKIFSETCRELLHVGRLFVGVKNSGASRQKICSCVTAFNYICFTDTGTRGYRVNGVVSNTI